MNDNDKAIAVIASFIIIGVLLYALNIPDPYGGIIGLLVGCYIPYKFFG